MPRARVAVIDVDLSVSSKKDYEEKKSLLAKNAGEIEQSLNDIELDLDEDSMMGEGLDEDEEAAASEEEDADAADKTAAHKAKWEKRKNKLKRYADSGKVEKLEKAMGRQQAKLEKAIDKGKPAVYIEYKSAKVEFTKVHAHVGPPPVALLFLLRARLPARSRVVLGVRAGSAARAPTTT